MKMLPAARNVLRRAVGHGVLMLFGAAFHPAAAADISLPPEPAVPTDMRQCYDLSQAYRAVEEQLRQEASRCHAASDKRGTHRVKCGAWVVEACSTPLAACEDVQERRKAAHARCVSQVRVAQDAGKAAKRAATDGALDLAERYLPGVREAHDLYAETKRRVETVRGLQDALFGTGSTSERYGAIAGQVSNLRGLGGGSALSRKVFDLAMKRINEQNQATLRTLEETIRQAERIDTTFPSVPDRPDPARLARERALRAEIAESAEAIERQRLAAVARQRAEERRRAVEKAEAERLQRERQAELQAAARRARERAYYESLYEDDYDDYDPSPSSLPAISIILNNMLEMKRQQIIEMRARQYQQGPAQGWVHDELKEQRW